MRELIRRNPVASVLKSLGLSSKPKTINKEVKEAVCTKIEIDPDGMIPLSVIRFNGKSFGEIRKFPKKIRDGVIASLGMLKGEGYKVIEYTSKMELILYDNQGSHHCTLAYKFLLKKSYLDLLCAVRLLHAHLEQKNEKSAAAKLGAATTK